MGELGIWALLGLSSALLGGLFNVDSTASTNKTNAEINERNLEYNTMMTQQQWERDDNAHQREVADLKAAGLSPLASVTGANVSSALGAPNPIAMQAPQFDTSTLVNSMLQAGQLQEQKRHNEKTEGYESDKIINQIREIENKEEELRLQGVKVSADIKYQVEQITSLNTQIAETTRHNKEQEKIENDKLSLSKLQALCEQQYKYIQSKTENYKLPWKGFYGEKGVTELEAYQIQRATALNDLLDKLKEYHTRSSNYQEASAQGAGGGAGGEAAGNGFSINLNGSSSDSSGFGYTDSYDKYSQKLIDEFNHDWPLPLYFEEDYISNYNNYLKNK